MSLRIIFMGTPAFSVPTLSELIGQGHDVVACYTRAPAPGGRRGLELVKSPVHQAAERFGIPVFTPKSLKSVEEQTIFAAHEADVAVVVAYGLILPVPVLEAPALGCLNLHASLLPRWRGAAPIQRAVMAGDAESGIMVMRMEEGLDTGPVGMVERVAITSGTTASTLHDRLMGLGADLMVRALAALERGSLNFTPQGKDGVTYAAKISKEETRINFGQPASAVLAHINGLASTPGAWCEVPRAEGALRIKVLEAAGASGDGPPGQHLGDLIVACSTGAVRLLRVQPAGKAPMSADEFQRGHQIKTGDRLG